MNRYRISTRSWKDVCSQVHGIMQLSLWFLSWHPSYICDMSNAEPRATIEPVIIPEFVDLHPFPVIWWRHHQRHCWRRLLESLGLGQYIRVEPNEAMATMSNTPDVPQQLIVRYPNPTCCACNVGGSVEHAIAAETVFRSPRTMIRKCALFRLAEIANTSIAVEFVPQANIDLTLRAALVELTDPRSLRVCRRTQLSQFTK